MVHFAHCDFGDLLSGWAGHNKYVCFLIYPSVSHAWIVYGALCVPGGPVKMVSTLN